MPIYNSSLSYLLSLNMQCSIVIIKANLLFLLALLLTRLLLTILNARLTFSIVTSFVEI